MVIKNYISCVDLKKDICAASIGSSVRFNRRLKKDFNPLK